MRGEGRGGVLKALALAQLLAIVTNISRGDIGMTVGQSSSSSSSVSYPSDASGERSWRHSSPLTAFVLLSIVQTGGQVGGGGGSDLSWRLRMPAMYAWHRARRRRSTSGSDSSDSDDAEEQTSEHSTTVERVFIA